MQHEKLTIGGSEIAAVMGLSRWETPLSLWAVKTGQIDKEDISKKEYVELGTELEDFVARKFSRVTGLKVRRDTKTFRHPKYSFAIAHIDRRITGTDELLECKTCSVWKEKEWEGEEIPTEYILQCIWYLGVLQMSKCYIAVLIGGQKFRWKEITLDKEMFDKMIKTAKRFIEENVKKNVMPMVMSGDSDVLSELYPKQESPLMQGDMKINDLIKTIQGAKKAIIDFEGVQEENEAKLKQTLGEAEGIETLNYRAIWKEQKTSRINFQRLKDDNLYDKYAEIKSSRVLRINKKKETK